MDTDALIDALARDTTPVSPRRVPVRLALSLCAGVAVALVMVAATLGFRPDLDVAMAGSMFWMKTAYTGSLALIALAALPVLLRPEARPPRWLWLLTLPVALLGVVSGHEMMALPHDQWRALWLGLTSTVCPWLILGLSLPIAGTLTIVARQFAPTRLRATGALIGLASGAAAATVYGLHCPEAAASFILTWYSLGIAIAAALGALLGPRLLRW